MNKETSNNRFVKMDKAEILKWIQQQIDKSIRMEKGLGCTETGQHAYQKVYDFIEYNLED